MDSPYLTDQAENASQAQKFFKILSNKERLLVMCNLLKSPKTVTELVQLTKLSQPALSLHLAELRKNKMLKSNRQGRKIYYEIANRKLQELVEYISYKFECW